MSGLPELQIREMVRDDVPAVVVIDRQSFPTPWSLETFYGELTNTAGYYRVAELGGRIVGYIGSQIILDEAHITTFGVDPVVRRRHIGERLFADVLRQVVRKGVRSVTLEVRESNVAAQNLYRKYGFQSIGRRKHYYTDNGEDAVVMWIDDTTRLGFRTLLAERLDALGWLDTDMRRLLLGAGA